MFSHSVDNEQRGPEEKPHRLTCKLDVISMVREGFAEYGSSAVYFRPRVVNSETNILSTFQGLHLGHLAGVCPMLCREIENQESGMSHQPSWIFIKFSTQSHENLITQRLF